MANTKAAMDTLVDAFNTYVDAGNYTSAKDTLIKISLHLATLPDTEQVRWGRTIQSCREMLQERESESASYTPKTVILRRDRSS